MKTIVAEKNSLLCRATEKLFRIVAEKPDAVILLSWDPCISELYDALAEKFNEIKGTERAVSFSDVRIVQAAEFEDKEKFLSRQLENKLISPLGISSGNVFMINESRPEEQEKVLERLGGADLCLLSPGFRAQVFFNETGAAYSSVTRRQKLTDSTRELFSDVFGSLENVPQFGYTAGIKTVVASGEIMVYASGNRYADAVFSMLYARDDSIVPAAFLQLPLNVEIYADDSAAEKL